jgi:hypothetical protein
MSYTNRKPQDFIKSLQIIHSALLIGVIGFGVFVALNFKNSLYFSYTDDKVFLYMAIIIAFGGNLASKYLYAKMIKQIPAKAILSLKAAKFSSAHIFRIAMLEFPALMCVIFTMQSGNTFYFILSGILIAMMVALYPSKKRFESDVPLSLKEKSMLEKL